MKWRSQEIVAWLVATTSENGTYRHAILREDVAARADGMRALARLVHEAHRDARERLERCSAFPLTRSMRPRWRITVWRSIPTRWTP